jgi:hypothetical protein
MNPDRNLNHHLIKRAQYRAVQIQDPLVEDLQLDEVQADVNANADLKFGSRHPSP